MYMYSNELEEAFSNFLDRHEYDEAEAALFSVVRLAFVAGWRAAGGTPPQAERIYELLPPPLISPTLNNVLKFFNIT